MARAPHKPTSIAVAIAAVAAVLSTVVGLTGTGGVAAAAVDPIETALVASGGETAPDADRTGGGVWALVVGVDDYPGRAFDLRAGVADARAVDAVLAEAAVPASQRRLVLDSEATAASLREGLDWLVTNAGPDATAVVFFSGHVREVGGDPDGDGEDVDEAIVLGDDSQLLDGELADVLGGLRARRAWIGLAGCYGGGFDDVLAPGRLLTAAAPEGDLAYENDAFGHTYLVEYMVRRAMLGGAAASIQEAFADAATAIGDDHPDRVPVMFDRLGEPLALAPT